MLYSQNIERMFYFARLRVHNLRGSGTAVPWLTATGESVLCFIEAGNLHVSEYNINEHLVYYHC